MKKSAIYYIGLTIGIGLGALTATYISNRFFYRKHNNDVTPEINLQIERISDGKK